MSRQKGITLIITFFIMTIILAIVLAITTILYSEIIVIKNVANSVVAFYTADGGVEKVLYYDRKEVPEGVTRGICNICAVSDNCTTSGTDCTKCKSCHISFETDINPQKSYNITADVQSLPGGQCGISEGTLESHGIFRNTTRAINLDITKNTGTELGPDIEDNGTTFKSNNYEEVIKIHVSAPSDLTSVKAYIYYSSIDPENGGTYALDTHTPNPVILRYNKGQAEWQETWNAHETGWYYVGIGAIDANDICASITITPE